MKASIHMCVCDVQTISTNTFLFHLLLLFRVILFSVLPFNTDWINTSYVSETLVDAREDQMTETGFSKMSWFHKEDRLFQYSVVIKMREACTGCCCWYKEEGASSILGCLRVWPGEVQICILHHVSLHPRIRHWEQIWNQTQLWRSDPAGPIDWTPPVQESLAYSSPSWLVDEKQPSWDQKCQSHPIHVWKVEAYCYMPLEKNICLRNFPKDGMLFNKVKNHYVSYQSRNVITMRWDLILHSAHFSKKGMAKILIFWR